MRDLVACAEAARLDSAVRERAALSAALLMEDASLRLWLALEPIAAALGAGRDSTLVALCGAGNNAGDALALLRHARFSGLAKLVAVMGKERPGELAAAHAASLRALGLPVLSWESDRAACGRAISAAGLLVDGIAGTGLSGALREPLASLVAAANASPAPVAAIDLPSGLFDGDSGGTAMRADWTLSIEPRKACLYHPASRPLCGEIVPVAGVFPRDEPAEPRARLLEAGDLAVLAPQPAAQAYKGSRGRVAAFAGALGSTGAAALSSRAALAAGAGIVALFAAPDILAPLSAALESVMVKPEPSGPGAIDAERWDAALAGPGWGRGERARAILAALLGSGLPLVLDADALHLYREYLDAGGRPSAPMILTPHPGEFARLAGGSPDTVLADPPAHLPAAARELSAIVVLKSHVTWIAAPSGELAVWDGMDPSLGTAGSGDVLAGLAAGLLAASAAGGRESGRVRGSGEADWQAAFAAACAAVIAHGRAGRRARESRGWYAAGALVDEAAFVLGAP